MAAEQRQKDNQEIIKNIEQAIARGVGINQLHDNVGNINKAFVHSNIGRLEVVQWLVENGADVNVRDSERWTPLMYSAVPQYDYETMLFLLENGANVNLRNDDGNTALYQAMKNDTRRSRIYIRALLRHGATLEKNENCKNMRGPCIQHALIYHRLTLLLLVSSNMLPTRHAAISVLPTDLLHKLKAFLLPVGK